MRCKECDSCEECTLSNRGEDQPRDVRIIRRVEVERGAQRERARQEQIETTAFGTFQGRLVGHK